MEIKRYITPSCCGKTALIFKLSKTIDKSLLSKFSSLGFKEDFEFTKFGILYMTSLDLIVTGPFGSTKLQVKCRKLDCEDIINKFEKQMIDLE